MVVETFKEEERVRNEACVLLTHPSSSFLDGCTRPFLHVGPRGVLCFNRSVICGVHTVFHHPYYYVLREQHMLVCQGVHSALQVP
jgi:hypothetical protein